MLGIVILYTVIVCLQDDVFSPYGQQGYPIDTHRKVSVTYLVINLTNCVAFKVEAGSGHHSELKYCAKVVGIFAFLLAKLTLE